jgi:hypothetical protein
MSSWLALGAALLGVTLSIQDPTVLVVGLDGADWRVLRPLFAAGHLPHLEALVDKGAHTDLDCVPAYPVFACYCPPVWTSIATGQPFKRHRIATTTDPSVRRQVAALWEVNHDAGGLSNLVSYRGTWPPEPTAGYVLTEPGLDVAAGERMDRWWPPQHPGIDRPDTHTKPVGILQTLGLLPYTGLRLPAWQMFARDRVAMQAFDGIARLQSVFRRHARRPRWRPPRPPRPTPLEAGTANLTLFVLHGIDRAQHMGWNQVQRGVNDPIDADAIVALADAWQGPVFDPPPWGWGSVASQYLEADAWIGRHLARNRYDYVVLVSDHGMSRNRAPRGVPGAHGPSAPEAHLGILSIQGRGVRANARIETASVLDVAPTVAYLLGLPVADDLPGRVLEEAFTASWLRRHPPRTAPSWAPTHSVPQGQTLP